MSYCLMYPEVSAYCQYAKKSAYNLTFPLSVFALRLMLTATLWGQHCHDSYFIDNEAKKFGS